MQRLLDRLAGCVLLFGIAACGIEEVEGFERLYHRHCAVCHGADLQGAAQGTPLVGIDLAYGAGIDNIARSIAAGMPDRGMPAWSETLSETQIRSLAIFISEERTNTTFADFRIETPLVVPTEAVRTSLHDFRLEVVSDGLDPLPYAIAPLPDGRILLTEKMRGLVSVAQLGAQKNQTPLPDNDSVDAANVVTLRAASATQVREMPVGGV